MAALRVLAFAIAVVAVIDPALTISRSSRPLVSLLTADPVRDADLANRVERTLSRQFTVVRGAIPSASGTVLVGDKVPEAKTVAPLLVVTPEHGTPFLRILSLDVPATPLLNTQAPVAVNVQLRGASGRGVDVGMRVGDVRVDQQLPVEVDTAEARATWHHIPAAVGTALLQVRAQVEGTNIADMATTSIDVRDDRLPVLFFDPRASWLSTFVRRAVERDPRFTVTHRVVTSRGISNSGGPAPVSLRDAHSLSSYATVVVGSPEQLTGTDVAGLEAFMRERGGRVVLLMDRRAAGPVDRLTGASDWRAVRLPSATTLAAAITDSRIPIRDIRAQEIAWPATLPIGASVHNVNYAPDSTRRSVVWSVPVGAGRLFVSGALDAWHYRDEGAGAITPNGASGFGPFWTSMIAELAASAPPAVEVTLSDRSVAPGQPSSVQVWVRDAALSQRGAQSATVSARLVGPHDTTNLRVWAGNAPGTFTGTLIAPRESGVYRIIASSGVERSDAAIIVDPNARPPSRDERHLMSAFASSRKGRLVPEAELRDLPRTLSSALQSVSRVQTWHPMRTAWWIVPFVLLLGAEWWWRRRRGLA
jgi:hypothetical protein